jgi:hypothetical protein
VSAEYEMGGPIGPTMTAGVEASLSSEAEYERET